jgi:peptidyl-prolyl cis-trans isomerase SurA
MQLDQQETQEKMTTISSALQGRWCTRPNLSRCLAAVFILSASFASLLLSGCHRTPGADIMATVNGKPILSSDVDKIYREKLNEQQTPTTEAPTQIQAENLRLNILHDLIDFEIMQQQAAKLKLEATDDDVQAKLTEIKTPYTQEQFDARLQAQGETLEDFKRDIRRQLTYEKLLNEEIDSKINITDNDITNYFNQHKSDFNLVQPAYHMAQIVVTTNPLPANQQVGNLQNSKANNSAEALKKIQDIRNRLESGEDFGSLAANLSEDHDTSPSGGDIGFVTESDLKTRPPVYSAVSTLKDGEITGIIPAMDPATRQPAAFAIFKLIEREPAGQRDLSDPRVQQAIRQLLRDSRSQLLHTAYSEWLHDQAVVVNYYAKQIYKDEAH